MKFLYFERHYQFFIFRILQSISLNFIYTVRYIPELGNEIKLNYFFLSTSYSPCLLAVVVWYFERSIMENRRGGIIVAAMWMIHNAEKCVEHVKGNGQQ